MGNHGERDTDTGLTIRVMVSRKFTLDDVLGMATIAILAFQRMMNLAVMMERRSMPTVDSKLFSPRR